MTIASACEDIGNLIDKHHVYGAEAVINALMRACKGRDYLTADDIKKLIDNYEMRWKER